MTKPQHTPAPWTVEVFTRVILIDSADGCVCEMPSNYDDNDKRRIANARLIAAAPELLEALEYFFNIMHDYESSRRKGYISSAFEQARAAIAKAKGGAR